MIDNPPRALLGKIELRAEPVDRAALVSEALHTLAATGGTAKHIVNPDLGEAWVRGDPVRWRLPGWPSS